MNKRMNLTMLLLNPKTDEILYYDGEQRAHIIPRKEYYEGRVTITDISPDFRYTTGPFPYDEGQYLFLTPTINV